MTTNQNLNAAHADLVASLVWRYAEDVQEILDDMREDEPDPEYGHMAIRERNEALEAYYREENERAWGF